MAEGNIPVHVVFVAAVVQKGELFLASRRADDDPQAPGVWALPGGKVETELGDNIIQTNLAREVREEVGFEITPEIELISNQGFVRVSGHHVVKLVFLCHWQSGEAKALEDQAEVRWVKFPEFISLLAKVDYHQQLIKTLKQKYGGS